MSAAGVPAAPRRWVTASEEETERLGAELAADLGADATLLLSGELGSGKTVLARGVAGALGIDRRQVLSPTFNLIREHHAAAAPAADNAAAAAAAAPPGAAAARGPRLIHVDLYRLEPHEVAGLGLEELLAGPGVKVVEWAERLPFPPPARALVLLLRRLPGGAGREIVEAPHVSPEPLENQLDTREELGYEDS